jgi:glycosyltransferase involved in cell wall biosynthesis
VLLSIYFKEDPFNFKQAIDSLIRQTCMPSEIVIVKDGLLTNELNELIENYYTEFPNLFKIVPLLDNVGLGCALNIGINHCSFEIIARMDSDDIAYHCRFEDQLQFLACHPEISVLGSAVQEFNEVPGDLNRFRRPPQTFTELKHFAKYRNPLNHPSVVFRKKDVVEANSYIDMPLFEDYYLWVRLIINGFQIANLSQPLLHFRVGNDMIGRRHGLSYLKKEYAFLKAIKRLGFITKAQMYISLISKSPTRLMPKNILEFIYIKFLR